MGNGKHQEKLRFNLDFWVKFYSKITLAKFNLFR